MVSMDDYNFLGDLSKGLQDVTRSLNLMTADGNRGLYDLRRTVDHFAGHLHHVTSSVFEIKRSLDYLGGGFLFRNERR